jgi:hypothetical protein
MYCSKNFNRKILGYIWPKIVRTTKAPAVPTDPV